MGKKLMAILFVLAASLNLMFFIGCENNSATLSAAKSGNLSVESRRITIDDYVDKMKAGWVGQMVGVGWGGPTEFRYRSEIIPEDKMPQWHPEMVNQFHQDDIYVEMTFIRSLELYGFDVTHKQAGIDFANSGYKLWHANRHGRENLRNGIAPPDSGHPKFNKHADDIDYQIEADFAGLLAPGLPNVAIDLGEKFGRLMNYGDGLYGGQFVAGMYAEAFFENDIEKIVRAGLKCIPQQSQYAECINDVLQWHKQYPDDWQKTWQLIDNKYHKNPKYRRFTCEMEEEFNIDAKINGAYIVMGLLYGDGDPDKTIIVSTRCGQDSDCNPSNAAGVLFTTIGYSNLSDKYVSAIDPKGKFSHTPYNFPTLIKVCRKLATQAVKRAGGHIEVDDNGKKVFVIPVREPKPGKLEQCWQPGPIAKSRYTKKEMEKIYMKLIADMDIAVDKFAPGWKIVDCEDDADAGLHGVWRGKSNVLVTHPLEEDTPCVLWKEVKIPENKKTMLNLTVGHHPEGDWVLVVKADYDELHKSLIGSNTTRKGWKDISIDLTPYTGKTVKLQLINQANGWNWEEAHWAKLEIVSQ